MKKYLSDKWLICVYLISVLLVLNMMFSFFEINTYLVIIIDFIFLSSVFFILIYDYFRKRTFYNNLYSIINNLDQKNLIHEMISNPSFYDGQIIYEILCILDKDMLDQINGYKYKGEEFREYLELWCHEIKTPVATTNLIIDNNHNDVTDSIKEEINKIETYIEQVLFYSRSDNVEKDYLIKKVDLKQIVDEVIRKNKKSLIEKKIKIIIAPLAIVNSDIKWLEFIINQIVSNSIKYIKNSKPYIKIWAIENKNSVNLCIEDNGIGIKEEELGRVFDKGFTGSNGRSKYNSTGIGLYLCKKLCLKLNHNITISSTINEKTTVIITFPGNSMSNVID